MEMKFLIIIDTKIGRMFSIVKENKEANRVFTMEEIQTSLSRKTNIDLSNTDRYKAFVTNDSSVIPYYYHKDVEGEVI